MRVGERIDRPRGAGGGRLGRSSGARIGRHRTDSARSSSNEIFTYLILGVLGRVELALGNLEAAGGYLRDLPGRLLEGCERPDAAVWADAIETLVALGELEQARATSSSTRSTRGAEEPLGRGGAARCRGLLAAAEGNPTAAFEAFDRALAELDAHPYPLERGRTLLCLGTVRRQAQQKKAAREALEQALAIFEELGARLWAEKARAELGGSAAARPPRRS